MNDLVDTHQLAGASLRVSRNGREIYRQYVGSYDATTRIPIASGSKWLSAIAIARLVDRGVIDWDSTVGEYFPGVAADKAGIRLAQLLSHTSGIPSLADDCLSSRALTLAACSQRILGRPLIATPGTAFAYGGNSMQVAGRMAEIAAGRSWDDIFIDEVALPLGLIGTDWAMDSTASGYIRHPNPRIAGGARSTLEDFGRAVDMVASGGLIDGRPFLSIKTLETMARDQTSGTLDFYRPAEFSTAFGYGIGQIIERADTARYMSGKPTLSAIGLFGFTAWVDHRRKLGGILMVRDVLPRVMDSINVVRANVEDATRPAVFVPPCTRPPRPHCTIR